MDGIEVVSIEFADSVLFGRVILNDLSPANCEFAFYILRDEERVHIQWYSEHATVEFDTEGIPGTYQIIAFKRVDETVLGYVKSAQVSANIVEAPALEQAEPLERAEPFDRAEKTRMFRRLWK
jgi:hypothetical protein